MGLLDRLGLGKRTADMLAGSVHLNANPYIEPGNHLLPAIVIDDLHRAEMDALPLDRAAAISIPAVSKARNLLTSSIARFPLRALRYDEKTQTSEPVKPQPTFLYRTDNSVTPYERMSWTVDDLIFYGYSLWIVERGVNKQITAAEWCPQKDWTITNGHVLVREEEVPEDSWILFNSPFEGLLNIGARTLRGARDQEASWIGRARNPIPLIELSQTDDRNLTEDEVEGIVKAFAAARTSENGAIGWTPMGLEIKTHGEVKADLMLEGRNAVRTDIGSFLNVRASMLDGTAGVDSLTYTTTEGERNSFYDIDLPFWMDVIEARLSMDDVVPRGQRVRFDKYDVYHMPEPTGPTVED